MSSFRYMGTKKYLATKVKRSIDIASKHGQMADLFSGMGAVAREFSSERSVFLNDAMTFPTVCSKAYFLDNDLKINDHLIKEIYSLFSRHRALLRSKFERRIKQEKKAVLGGSESLNDWMLQAPHVGNSTHYNNMKNAAKLESGPLNYQLITLYFSASYFSTSQAIDLDALRYAIESLSKRDGKSPLIAVWLSTASVLINAPGHSAQFLKPNNDSSYNKICRGLTRDVWATFVDLLSNFSPCGSLSWRKSNKVSKSDVLKLLDVGLPSNVSVVYADPPYTGDQYSRYYHVFETMLLYNYPTSKGCGRYPEGRFTSPFCLKTKVVDSFEQMFCRIIDHSVPLVLSYPSNGLLSKVGVDIIELANDTFRKIDKAESQINHSTMGASKGAQKKSVKEYILTCYPA